MKRMGNVLVAVAMMVGAVGATGCKKDSDQASQQDDAPVVQQPVAQDDTPAPADDTAPVTQAAAVQLPAPPALRVENPGAAPSAHHVWQRGFWRWDAAATNYVWAPGYWENTAVYAPYAPPARRYEYVGYAPGAGYLFVPGYWRWGGSEYAWVYGHWCSRADAGFYYHSRWAFANGRWEHHFDRWDGDRWAAYNNRHGYGQGRGEGLGHGYGHGGVQHVGQQGGGQHAGQQGGGQHAGQQGGGRQYHAAAGDHRVAPTERRVIGHTGAGPVRRGHG